MAIYTADFSESHAAIYDISRSYGRQLLWIGVSLFAGLFIMVMDSRLLTGAAYFLYGVALFFLVAVLIAGSVISGSQSWFKLGFFNFQPSELAKFATCLALAKHLAGLNMIISTYREHTITAGIILLPVMLTLLQGDAGSSLVFSSLLLVLYREGLSGVFLAILVIFAVLFALALLLPIEAMTAIMGGLGLIFLLSKKASRNKAEVLSFILPVILLSILNRHILPGVMLLLTLLTLTISTVLFSGLKKTGYFLLTAFLICFLYVKSVDYAFNNFLKPHQKNRIGVVLGIIEDKQGVGYNLNQSKIAIGSGGLWGKGWMEGTQNKGNFVPELSTDFIFCTIGEEFGFMGSVFIIGLYVLFLSQIIRVAERQQSPFTRIYGYGIASIFFFHFAVNISMTIGLLPIIGIPLPFLSYGGSSFIAFSVMFFAFLKFDSERTLFLR